MKILYFTWYENSEHDIMEALLRLGHCVVKCNIPFQNYEEDVEFTHNLEKIFLEQKCEVIFSINYFPMIAKTADKMKKKYVSWVYDMPHWTLFSPTIKSEYVYVFVFDHMQYIQVKKIKNAGIYHLPMAVNSVRLNDQIGNLDSEIEYQHEISFVGSLYENNLYDKITYLPDYLKGYINGILAAQGKIYGYNMVSELLSENIITQLNQYVSLDMTDSYFVTYNQLYSDIVNEKLTSQERKKYISELAKKHEFLLCTASDGSLIPKAKLGGTISYGVEMPQVFRHSKINLNITLRSIISGISLRVMDILGAGGFLLSNYQQEIAENFIDGKEVVLFESEQDMLEKAAYYLQNEEGRKEIAYNGWKKVQEKFTYDDQLTKIFEIVGTDTEVK